MAVANNLGGDLTIYLGNGQLSFTTAECAPQTGAAPQSIATANFDGDGKLDLAIPAPGSDDVAILLGNGDGSFIGAPANPFTGAGPTSIVAADFNSDRKMDLAVSNETDNSVTVLLGNGDGTFTTASTPATGTYPDYIAVQESGIRDPRSRSADV